MIKYIGSKRELLPHILQAVEDLGDVRTILDPFSGTARVGHAFKKAGYRVHSNDHNAYAATLATCYVQADAERVAGDAERLIGELNSIPGEPGYVTETFCEKSRFFHPKNGARIDAMREAIASKDLDEELKSVLLVSLMEAADRVDSTTGVQMAYLKSWASRAHNDIELRVPKLLPQAKHGPGLATMSDAYETVKSFEGDLVYLDPPYNQHSYLGNYHVWESLVRWDKPAVYGVACKRIDCKERKSPYNSKRKFRAAFGDLFASIQSRYLLLSFNNEGFLGREDLMDLLSEIGDVECRDIDYKRYVGAQIGIYNPGGKKVGRVSHLRNKEFLFLVRAR